MNDSAKLFSDESIWQQTFDAVPDLIFVLDREHRIVRANRAAAERLGCTVEQLAGRGFYELIHGTNAPPASCPHVGMLRDGSPQTGQLHELSLGGVEYAITVTLVCDGQGRIIGSIHMAYDVTHLKRTEEELRRTRDQIEQRHALAVAALLDGLWEWDLTTDRVLYSDRYLELLGYRREEISGTIDFFKGRLHPEDAPALWRAVERTLAEKVAHEVEVRLRAKAGEYRWFLTRGQAEWDAAGKPTRMAGTIQDITERKRAEEEREERARFESLLADISARFVGGPAGDVDAEIGCALEGIRRFFQVDQIAFLKYETDSACIVQSSHWSAEDDVTPVPTDLNGRLLFPWNHDQLRSGEPLVLRGEDLPPEAGTDRESFARFGIRAAVVVPLLEQGGTPQYLLCLAALRSARQWPADIVVRLRLLGEIFVQALLHRQADEELREAELKYHTVADFSADWEYWQDAEQGFRYMSPSCEEITGYSREELTTDPLLLREMAFPEDRDIWDEHRRKFHDGCQAGSLEFRIVRRDGPVVWLHHVCRPIRDPQGRFLGTRVSNRDVSQRKAAEEALEAALAEIGRLKERLERENVYLQNEIKSQHDFDDIVGQSATLRITLHKVSLVAETGANVLLLGETGTGKELLARAIHDRSPRRKRPLVKVNCAALPSSLIESELFGHVKGAFTGALSDKIGRFELADGGTLFLDEIGELDPDLQTKLLRVLQDGEFERIGSSQTIRVDVRLIAATNRDLHEALRDGTFRPDLYYRLSVFPIELPPLRARREDIPLLVWHFITTKQRRLGKKIEGVPREVMDQLIQYDWPGNVRELENVIERAIILSPGTTLVLSESLDGARSQPAPKPPAKPAPVTAAASNAGSLAQIDRAHILDVLDQCGWKIKGPGNAAQRLGLNPSTLRFRMKKLGIQRRPKPR